MKEEAPAPHPHVDVDKVYSISNKQPAAPVDKPAAAPHDATRVQFRKYFLYVLISGVVISALISIVAILVGEINDYITRALWTTVFMVIHAMIALAFMSATAKQRTTGQELVFNTLFGITIASFFTATLGLWQVISGQTVVDFYQLYFYALCAVLIIQMLLSVNVIDKITNQLMRVAIGITVALWAYLIPSVFDNGYVKTLPEIYYRGIAAIGILLGTVLVLVAIFHRLYFTKHPELKAAAAAQKHGTMPVWLIVILCVIGIPMALAYLSTIFGVLGYFLRIG